MKNDSTACTGRVHRCKWIGCREGHRSCRLPLCDHHLRQAALGALNLPSVRLEVLAAINDTPPTPQPEPAPDAPTDGTVYALLSGYNVKVGWTGRDLQDRLREYPPSTTLLVHFPGRRGDETRIKRKFAHLRTHGNEWFPYAPQVTEWVEQMVTDHGQPDPAIACGPAKYQVPRPHSTKAHVRPRGWVGS